VGIDKQMGGKEGDMGKGGKWKCGKCMRTQIVPTGIREKKTV